MLTADVPSAPTRRWQDQLRRLIRFGLVGVANTALYYGCYRLLLLVMPYLVAHLLAWAVSVVFSFFVNCWFTYRVRPTWKRFFAFPLGVLTNLAFTTIGTVILVEGFNFSEAWAPLVCGILAIPFTYAVTTFALTNSKLHSTPTGERDGQESE